MSAIVSRGPRAAVETAEMDEEQERSLQAARFPLRGKADLSGPGTTLSNSLTPRAGERRDARQNRGLCRDFPMPEAGLEPATRGL
jgi:hypothetical protein